jgi:biotin transport system substrate-specific component
MTETRSMARGEVLSEGGLKDCPQAGALRRATGRVLPVLGFAVLTWAGARISVPLPWTPVPATLQTLAVLLAGACLGARAGAASQIAYVSLGLSGLPVFALPGGGPPYFLSPTGGYLAGFVAGAYVSGRLQTATRRWGLGGLAASLLAGAIAIHACGLPWLAFHLGGDLSTAARAGLWPFLPFDLAKVVIATGIAALYRRAAQGGAAWKNVSRS